MTADGALHEIDVLVCATGFDAVDGNYVRVNIQGRDGESLKEHWRDGPTSYLGMATSGFPNLFMILGPNGPFANVPPSIETQVRVDRPDDRERLSHRPRLDRRQAGDGDRLDQHVPGHRRRKRSSARSPRGSSAPTSPGRSRPSCSTWAAWVYRELLAAETADGYPSFSLRTPPLPVGASRPSRRARLALQH